MTEPNAPDAGRNPPWPQPEPTSPGSIPPPPTPPPSWPSAAPPEPKRRRRWPYIVGACAGVLVLLGVIGALANRSDESRRCRTELTMLEIAIEAFAATRGEPPESASVLVTEGFLRSEPEFYTVTDGAISVQPGAPCSDGGVEARVIEYEQGALDVGDCVRVDLSQLAALDTTANEGTTNAGIDEVPCDEAHDAEVLSIDDEFFASDADAPTAHTIGRRASPFCVGALEAYTAERYEESPYDIFSLYPVEPWWPDDRSLTCFGFTIDPRTSEPVQTTKSIASTAEPPEVRGEFLSVFFMEPGECFTVPPDFVDAMVSGGRRVPCDTPHAVEVVANDASRFDDLVRPPAFVPDFDTECARHTDAYSDVPFEERDYEVLAFAPTEFDWSIGARGLVCTALKLTPDLDAVGESTASIARVAGGAEERTPPVENLRGGTVGACYRMGDVYFEVLLWSAIPIGRPVDCNDPHDAEIVAIEPSYFADATAPPAAPAALRHASEQCVTHLEDFTGQPYDTSLFDTFAEVPAIGDWESGDRSLVCVGFELDQTLQNRVTSTGSMGR